MKRILSLFLATILLSSAALAAQTDAEQLAATTDLVLPTPDLPLTTEPTTLEVMFRKAGLDQNYDEMFQLRAIEQLTGIQLKVKGIEAAAWSEKLPLAMMGGEYGDIFLNGISTSDAASFGQAGYLLPLEDLIAEHAPNAMRILETIPYARKNATADDGHIYLMSAYDGTPRDMMANIFQEVNGEWLAKLNMKVPDTLDGFYEMLKAFKERDPNGNGKADEIPWSFVWNNGLHNVVLGAFGYVGARHDIIDGNYVYVPAEENYRHYVEFMHKLYSEGLLDPDVFTQTGEEYKAKMQQMIVGFTPNNHYGVIGIENYLKMVNMRPMTSQYNDKPTSPGRFTEVHSIGMCITNKCSEEDAILAIKLLDYFYSEEGTFLTKCGPEYGAWGDMVDGGYQRISDENGTTSYKLIYDEKKFDNYPRFRTANLLMQAPWLYTKAHEAVIVGSDPGNNHITVKCLESGMLEARRVGYHTAITYTEDEEAELVNSLLMDDYVNRRVAYWVKGDEELNDDTWADYLSNLEALGLKDFSEIRQEAYDRWLKK